MSHEDDKLADLVNWKVMQALANQTLRWSSSIEAARMKQTRIAARRFRYNWLKQFKKYNKEVM